MKISSTWNFRSIAGKIMMGLVLAAMIGSMDVAPALARDGHKQDNRGLGESMITAVMSKEAADMIAIVMTTEAVPTTMKVAGACIALMATSERVLLPRRRLSMNRLHRRASVSFYHRLLFIPERIASCRQPGAQSEPLRAVESFARRGPPYMVVMSNVTDAADGFLLPLQRLISFYPVQSSPCTRSFRRYSLAC